MGKNLELENQNVDFGILGRNISYSFSAQYFTDKFKNLGLNNYRFHTFDIDDIKLFKNIISKYPNLKGLSVTIPYKELIIPLLDELSNEAKIIGAVNSIKVSHNKLIGYNTDALGFEYSFKSQLKPHHKNALILGTGGASKAVQFVLNKLAIPFKLVSRMSCENKTISYDSIDENMLKSHQILINCSPVGTFPDVNLAPQIPYHLLNQTHYLFDLVYNPTETLFLKKGKLMGAEVKNGYDMLIGQAEKSWEIWNNN